MNNNMKLFYLVLVITGLFCTVVETLTSLQHKSPSLFLPFAILLFFTGIIGVFNIKRAEKKARVVKSAK
ncbi:hypothetical protein [Psychromonas sp. SR45-3]|uniref:hypothetical protein n=1 Tax=Psychromonas sp. SR45-3 TaxID=2760930 RepID=UPI0015F7F9D2|nr:hypothetical protein [Psychromonas sp. SR45-3]MBB1272977.1 hypothetical protein [Psychromonas sp. SR45-3]